MTRPNDFSMRYFEIDLLRSLGLVGMGVYHFFYDLVFFHGYGFQLHFGPWRTLAFLVQIIFMLTTGMTTWISYQRRFLQGGRFYAGFHLFKHALWLAFFALIVSGVTWFLFDDQFVRFGVLHFYSLAIVLILPVLLFRWHGFLFFLMPLVFVALWLDFPGFNTLLGIRSTPHFALDYFPLIPWFFLFSLGFLLARFFYPMLRRSFSWGLGVPSWGKWAYFLSRHSLWIYLIHQPVLALFVVGVPYLFTP